jgi:hypothetical protein
MKSPQEVDGLVSTLLDFLGTDHGSTDNPELSFECGALAALDWARNRNSVYAEILEGFMVRGSYDVYVLSIDSEGAFPRWELDRGDLSQEDAESHLLSIAVTGRGVRMREKT